MLVGHGTDRGVLRGVSGLSVLVNSYRHLRSVDSPFASTHRSRSFPLFHQRSHPRNFGVIQLDTACLIAGERITFWRFERVASENSTVTVAVWSHVAQSKVRWSRPVRSAGSMRERKIGTHGNAPLGDVRSTPKSGHVRCKHRCPLSANSGHPQRLAQHVSGRGSIQRPKAQLPQRRTGLAVGLQSWKVRVLSSGVRRPGSGEGTGPMITQYARPKRRRGRGIAYANKQHRNVFVSGRPVSKFCFASIFSPPGDY